MANTNPPHSHSHPSSPSPPPTATPAPAPLPPRSTPSSLPSVSCSSPHIENSTPHRPYPHHLFRRRGSGSGSGRYYGREELESTPASSPPPLFSSIDGKGMSEKSADGADGAGAGAGGTVIGGPPSSPETSSLYPLPVLPLIQTARTNTNTKSLSSRSRARGALLSERVAGYEGLGSGERQPHLSKEKANESVTAEEIESGYSPFNKLTTLSDETPDPSPCKDTPLAASSPFDAFFAAATDTRPRKEVRRTDYSRMLSGSPGIEAASSPPGALHVPEISLPKRRLALARFGYTGEEEDDREDEDEVVPGRIDTSRLLNWERTGLECPTSRVSSDLHLSPTETEEEARRFWDDVLDQINAAGDRVLRDDENNPDFPRVNSSFCCFYASGIPSRGVHSEPTGELPGISEEGEQCESEEKPLIFSELKKGREEVLQVFLGSHPTDGVSEAFFDRTELLNKEASRRALCIDDPDAPAVLSPKQPDVEEVKAPLHKSLKMQLPSSHTFTATTYRSKYHRIQDVEAASAYPGVALRDYTLKARADQYGENKKILESSLAPEKERNASSGAAVTSKCSCHDDVTNSESRPSLHSEHSRTYKARAEDELHFTILRQWELARDIERLGAFKRNVESARTRLRQHPLLSHFSVYRKSFARRPDSMSENGTPPSEPESTGALVDSIPPPGVQLRRSRVYDDLSLQYALGVSGSGAPTQPSSNGDALPCDSNDCAVDVVFEMKPVVYNDRDAAPRNEKIKSRPRPLKSGNTTLDDRNRAAAHDIIRSLGTVSRSIQKSGESSISGSLENGGSRTERGGEQTRRDGFVSTSLLGHEERYPKRLNIVQR